MTAGDQNASPVVRHHPTLLEPFNETIPDSLPRHTGLVAIPSTISREEFVNDMLAANASQSRVHVQQMTNGWKEDAKGVLIFVSSVQLILAFHHGDFFQRPASSPQSSHRLSLRARKCYPRILETKPRFNLHHLPPPQSSPLT